MITNYIKIAWRNLQRRRIFSTINILGLAIGLATCLLMSLFIVDELSYDRFHENADRIVRVVFKGSVRGGELNEAHVMPPVAQTLKTEFPEVEDATRIRQAGRPFFEVNDQLFYEEDVAFADANIFDIFSFNMLYGDPKTALVEPNTVVITQTVAKKYFGVDNAVGKELRIKGEQTPLKVTGVIDGLPANSHFHFDLFASMASFPNATSTSWMESEFFTYLLLRPGYHYKELEAKLPTVFEKYVSPQFPEAFGFSYSEYRKAGNTIGLYLQPLTDIHLYSDFAYDFSAPGNIQYVYIFGSIAGFMLLIAVINFMNLSTAGAANRAKEVGVRKVLGAKRTLLTYQFLVESLLLTFIALVLAVCIAAAALPIFNELSGKQLTLNLLMTPWLLPAILLFGLFIGVLAGSYPALFLSAFKPVIVLKGRFATSKKSLGLRSGLVVFQFFISVGLIFCTTVVYKQLRYIQQKNLGYDQEQVLILQTWPLGERQAAFRQQLTQDSRVINTSNSVYIPAGPSANNNFFIHPQEDPSLDIKTLRYDVDEHYLPTLGIELKAGRNFSNAFSTDSSAVIINEAAAAAFGWDDDALGKVVANQNHPALHIIGIVKDFHFKPLHERITPLVMKLADNTSNLIVKVKTEDMAALLQALEAQYNALQPELPFSYSFLDERVNNTYHTEIKTGRILGIFAGLTIFIACLGLFGLATFTVHQRTKEIGIRKVLGASAGGIATMLSKDFIRLVLVAIVIASPCAWWMMNRWLADFAYRIEIQGSIFVLAGVSAISIALLTVSWQAIKAAITNPVDSLRDE